jgi:hypothetical protein
MRFTYFCWFNYANLTKDLSLKRIIYVIDESNFTRY